MVPSDCFLWVRLSFSNVFGLSFEGYVYAGLQTADQVSILLSLFADFIWGSGIMYYISNLIVERIIEEAFIFGKL